MKTHPNYLSGINPRGLLVTLFLSITLGLAGCGGGGSSSGGGSGGTTADTVAPVITVTGASSIEIDQNDTYTDQGATASDAVDGTVTVTSAGTVDTATAGTYTITYSVSDSAGNTSSATRTVIVSIPDTTAPVITIVGDNPATIDQNQTYTDGGATATDDVDGSVSVTTSGSIDTATAGTQTLTYTATDAAGNVATATRTVNVTSVSLSGTAAAGAAIVGTVTVKDALGESRSAIIEANGNYTVDVSGLTAPFRLRAQGTVGGKTYKLHSYAEAADVGNTINITPFTDLIIANTAQQIAETFFDSDASTSLDATELEAQEYALQSKLQAVFTALGLDTAIDLLSTSFSADHSGLDAALDIIQIQNSSENIVTITNLLDDSTITDDITDTGDNDTAIVVDADALVEAVSDTQAIANLFIDFAAEFDGGLPSSATIEDFLATDFLQNDNTRGEFLTDISTDPTLIGLTFVSVSVSDLDSTAGTARVSFNVMFADQIDPESETWLVSRDDVLGWQLLGDQRIVDVDELSYHCNEYDGNDDQTGACGINVRFWDENFNNNGTGGLPIASGTVSVIDGSDGTTVKDIVFLGTPDDTSAGDVQVYNEAEGHYQGDWREFGSSAGQIDSAIFAVGDIIEYKIYTDALDLSTPTVPAVTGTAVATYTGIVQFTPSLIGLYPSATAATIIAIDSYTLGDDLTVEWTLASGTVSDEVLVHISDNVGNRIEIWDESFGTDVTSASFTTSMFDDALLDSPDFDPTAEYSLLVRIYAIDPTTGQNHSTDYRMFTGIGDGTGGGGGDGTDPTPTGLTCGYESFWDDTVDGGLGAPVNPNSFADFETVLADCGGGLPFSAADVAGNSFLNDGETSTFFDTGAGTVADPSTGEFDDGSGEPAIPFEWYVENAANTNYHYLVLYTDSTIAVGLPDGFSIRETSALTALNGEKGAAGTDYVYVKYSEGSNYGDMVRSTGDDGEIWSSTDVLQ